MEQFPAIIGVTPGRAGGAWLDELLKQQLIRSYYLRLNLNRTFNVVSHYGWLPELLNPRRNQYKPEYKSVLIRQMFFWV